MVKIKSIRKIIEKEKVYDIIGIPINHNYIANNFIVHNCDIYSRGKGIVFVRDLNPVSDSWKLKQFEQIGAYNEFTEQHKIEEKLKRHPNFWTTMSFPKPPKWLYDNYLRVREKNVYDDDNILANLSNLDIINALLIMTLRDIITDDTTLSMNRVILHIKNKYDINIAKKDLLDSVEDAKQLVVKLQEKSIGLDKKNETIQTIEEREVEDVNT